MLCSVGCRLFLLLPDSDIIVVQQIVSLIINSLFAIRKVRKL